MMIHLGSLASGIIQVSSGVVRGEPILQMDDLMFRFDQNVQTLGEFRRQVIIEKKTHAACASASSNSTASRTSSAWTSYQRATISAEALALTLRASVCAGTPDFATVG